MADEYRLVPTPPSDATRYATARSFAHALKATAWLVAIVASAVGVVVCITSGPAGLVSLATLAVPSLIGAAVIHLLCDVARAIFDIADRS